MSVLGCATRYWHRFDIRRIENLENAVLGADVEAVQMAGPRIGGSLAFGARDGIVVSSGLINGKVALRGPLSHDAITVGLGLRIGPGSRQWLNEVIDGDVGIYLPGDDHDAIYSQGTLYAAVTLTAERLKEQAACEGLVLDPGMLARTGLHGRPIQARDLARITRMAIEIHKGGATSDSNHTSLGVDLLRVVVAHYARLSSIGDGRSHPKGRARIVHAAREYIRENLHQAITTEDLAMAAGASKRTLYRAFSEVLGDTPQDFVRRLRLHQIRRDLVLGRGTGHTVSAIARSWASGTDLGHMSARYQQLFGERPSATLADRERLQSNILL